MIELYTWTTPNGHKPMIMLEELGLERRLIPVNIGKGEQHAPDYLRINPNGRIPALVDRTEGAEPVVVFESGAILIYLAEKTGQLLPASGQERYEALAWLMFQMGGVGPMFGQAGHFLRAAEKLPYAIDRYVNESRRLYGVLDGRLAEAEYLAGDYSIADIATFPWARQSAFLGLTLDEFPNVKRWVSAIAERPAVERALNIRF
jgi:GSH-dependent disulfide-bond oxidoreductase